MRAAILLLCFGLTLTATPDVSAQTTSEGQATPNAIRIDQTPTVTQLTTALSHFERTATRTELHALGPQTLSRLFEIYQAPSTAAYVRLRALGALRHFPSPATRAFLIAVLQVPNQTDLHKRHALLSLAHGFGVSVRAEITPYLGDSDPIVRAAAGRARAHLGAPSTLQAISDRLAVETNDSVRHTLRQLRSR